MTEESANAARFAGIERVVADPLRFKLRLCIGDDAFASLRLKKNLQKLVDVGGMAATGAAVAASPIVASTFFASKGVLALLGFGAATTPIGWVAAAAVATAGAYYGVGRMFSRYSASRVDVVPKFINTPIDLLAATLLDLIGALAVRVAQIDGRVEPHETDVIIQHFVADWGLDARYVELRVRELIAEVDGAGVKELARRLAAFQVTNPDCNPGAMQAELLAFLRDIAEADGVLDEREELALEAIAAVLKKEAELSFRNAGQAAATWSMKAGEHIRKGKALVSAGATKSPRV